MKIKIIKKKDLKSVDKTSFPVEKNKRQKAKREMSSAVSGWVDEFRLLRGEKPKQVFEQLFSSTLSPAQSSQLQSSRSSDLIKLYKTLR